MPSSLNPLLYLRRNPGRTLPMMIVIMLAAASVASVVTIVHSIDLTVYTLYGSNRYMTGITPRNAITIDEEVVSKVRNLPEVGFLCPSHSYQTMVKTIFGKMPFPIFGLDARGRKLMMERSGVSLAQGRLIEDGKPEALISEDVARNLGVRIGDVISQPESTDSFAPEPVRLVGTLRGKVWLGLTSRALVDRLSPYTFHGYIAFAPTTAGQRRLDKAIEHILDKKRAREWQFSGLVKETRSSLSNLYLIMNIVIGIIVFAISFVCGLLSNIYFTQRLPEIATLSAIGYSRAKLLWRAVAETGILCAVGWLMGACLTVGLLQVVRLIALAPKGLLLNPVDPDSFLLTLPLPITITAFAFFTIWWRLNTLDPVSIIERRA